MADGRRAGLASVLGVETGTLLHVAAAAAGLSALLASSAVAFAIVKYTGAAYLVVLGIRVLLADDPPAQTSRPAPVSLGRAYRQGIVVQVLNPKVALFFLALLPQGWPDRRVSRCRGIDDPGGRSQARPTPPNGTVVRRAACSPSRTAAGSARTARRWPH
jgi:hypothetical protein